MCPQNNQEKEYMESIPYSNLIGALIFLSITIRFDVCFHVNSCARYMANPGIRHWNAALDILVYLRTNPDYAIRYTRYNDKTTRNILIGWCDSNHAGCPDTKRSTTGFCTKMNGGLISYGSKLQDIASGGGSPQSEYQALYTCNTNVINSRQVLEEIGYKQEQPTIIYEDNQPAIDFAWNPINHSRMNGILTKYHATRDYLRLKLIDLQKISKHYQWADIGSKAQDKTTFKINRENILVKMENYEERKRKINQLT
jgi:hypothetical protein